MPNVYILCKKIPSKVANNLLGKSGKQIYAKLNAQVLICLKKKFKMGKSYQKLVKKLSLIPFSLKNSEVEICKNLQKETWNYCI